MVVIIARKFSIAFTQIMFRGNPTFQLSIALLVMFLAYVAQVECRPYMSNSEMREVVEEAIANGDMPDACFSPAAIREYNLKRRKRAKKKVRLGLNMTKEDYQMVVLYVFDYNTVESILLGCAVLINLCGIMFSSGRFETELYVEQQEFLAWTMAAIVSGSLMYYMTVVVFELFGSFGILPYFKSCFRRACPEWCADDKSKKKKKTGSTKRAELNGSSKHMSMREKADNQMSMRQKEGEFGPFSSRENYTDQTDPLPFPHPPAMTRARAESDTLFLEQNPMFSSTTGESKQTTMVEMSAVPSSKKRTQADIRQAALEKQRDAKRIARRETLKKEAKASASRSMKERRDRGRSAIGKKKQSVSQITVTKRKL